MAQNPIYTNFEGGARVKKIKIFGLKFFGKVPKNAFLARFFFFCSAAQNKIGQNMVLIECESSENQFD